MGHMIFQSVWLCLILFLGTEPFSQKEKKQQKSETLAIENS